ncbi:MAG: hypothetical protein JW388_0948 [Nitrospira sp.]|nr:hypothetical protein [Nitrospira sp.]
MKKSNISFLNSIFNKRMCIYYARNYSGYFIYY